MMIRSWCKPNKPHYPGNTNPRKQRKSEHYYFACFIHFLQHSLFEFLWWTVVEYVGPRHTLYVSTMIGNRSLWLSLPIIWTQGKVNLPIPRNSPQITLRRTGRLGLCPKGKGALVVTGRPVGTGTDGRFRRVEVGLCIMWLVIAVTVSLLSPPLGLGWVGGLILLYSLSII